MSAFLDFLSRAQRFRPLSTTMTSSSKEPLQSNHGNNLSTGSRSIKKNIILVEDLPPLSAFSSRKIFQEAITKFSSTRNTSAVLVIIVSDVFTKQSTELLFSSTNENRDPALTIRTLFPSSVLDRIDSAGKGNPRVKQIKFNPIALTIMKKAINKLVKKEFGTRHKYAPSEEEIDQAIEIHDGDIRAVINSLQFLCYLPAKNRKSNSKVLGEERHVFNESEDKATQGQDSSLGIFHAVGRVLYNRRDWNAREEFDEDIELIEKLPVDPDLYILMLHQNYTRHMNKIEECQTAIEYLCIADQFSSHPSNSSSASYTQLIQMQPYMTTLAVRGMLFAPTSSGPSFSNTGGAKKKHWWPEYFAVNRVLVSNDQMFAEVAADLAGEEDQELSAGHISGPGFFPKRVVREELVPMLHKCITINPYMTIWNKSLRASSKNFVRNAVGNYGRKMGMVKKEFGEGDEGFLEEITDVAPPLGAEGEEVVVVDEIIDDFVVTSKSQQRQQQQRRQQQQQQQQQQGKATVAAAAATAVRYLNPLTTYEIQHEEDPIEDFSD
ncbi:Cell cycle checkpoint protein rad17 [Modicella reniformis]|uniref:Cell cycle checkpoint protein rad17 n=1 Tax=Modicella reniformis TaxID=1440133 RepID=A0A9P6STM9_9FUNG|nr:Cell cycle checkpoint protein rad17 [Modicella reniformis]